MKKRNAMLAIVIVALLTLSFFFSAENLVHPKNKGASQPEFYVGVECGYDNVTLCKALIEKVKDYTNLFVVGSTEIVKNASLLNEVCDYAYQAGMHVSVYFSPTQNYSDLAVDTSFSAQSSFPLAWVKNETAKYGDRFLGAYVYDEPGGNQLDGSKEKLTPLSEQNYQNAADSYVANVSSKIHPYLNAGLLTYTSDYALYWFDYKAGYDVVLAELGGDNASRQLPISLCRGAATAQGKDWGIMVTTRDYNGTILESGPELYDDLVLGYNSGAKYAVVFDYALTVSPSAQVMVPYQPYQYGILQDQHFEALKNFWTYVQQNSSKHGSQKADIALVVPQNIGFGFRSADDTVWGFAGDAVSRAVWSEANSYMNQYGERVDIVYNDSQLTNTIKTHYTMIIKLPNDTAAEP